MNWRLATLINAGIAVITITLIALNVPRARSRHHSTAPSGTSDVARLSSTSFRHPIHPSALDIAHAQVESFATVAPSEFYEILLRATPDEIGTLALKFNQLPINSRSQVAVGMFFQAWAELDAKSAIQGAFRINDVQLRRIAASTVVHSLSPSIAPEIAAFLKEHPDKDLAAACQNDFMATVLATWADVDPAAAASFYDELGTKSDSLSGMATRDIAWAWGTMDPMPALDWIEKQGNDVYSGTLFDSVVSGWVRNDAQAAMGYVLQHLDHPGANEAASSIALELLNRDPNSAARWVSQLPPGEPRTSAEDSVASVWSERDPAAAARWTRELPPDDQTSTAYTVARIWALQDWPATQRWLAELSGDYRDMAIAGAVTSGQAEPAESLPLAVSIANPESRIHTLQYIIESWADTDREKAAAWINNSTITRAEKDQLLSLDVFARKSEE